ncbi:hypothetical protein GGU10DRAFT_382031 [Lentinula aff. detonsa]|uniref:Uncharacterized protein n=1 Tax=Lentinula aff. detonsa TaxID=2804958 RepID=A0AA38NH56_9AGAR|nr:hypothetical protein GGU10DRAFT_382031 [Lentinula aff. detonsa]
MSSPQKLTSSQIAAQLCQMQEQLLAAQEEERVEAERAKRAAKEQARRAAEERKKTEEKELAEKKRRIEEAKRAKAAKKKLEEAEKKRQEELAEARRGKAREVVPSQKRVRDDISDPLDPPYEEESMDNDSEQDEEPKAPKKKKRKGNNAQPIASTSSARPACTRCVEKEFDCRPQDQLNTVSCYHCRNDKVKSNPIVGDASQPTEIHERIAMAMEGIQDSMVGIAYELRQFRLQVGSWQDTILANRSRRARTGEALEALEIERELVELEEEEEDFVVELRRQKQEAELGEEEEDEEEEEEEEEEEKEKIVRRSAPI